MVSAQDILKTEVVKRDANDTFSQAINLFNATNAVIITDHGKYHGMLLKRTLIEPTVTLQRKLHTMITHTPKLTPITPLEEIARVMVENNVYSLPVIHNDVLLGIVTADGVVEKLTEQNIGEQPIKTIMCSKPLSVGPNETITLSVQSLSTPSLITSCIHTATSKDAMILNRKKDKNLTFLQKP